VQPKFIRISNRFIRLDAISYIDFLDSGRAMIILSGVPPEKAHISLDFSEGRALRNYLDLEEVSVNPTRDPRPAIEWPRHLSMRS